MPSAKNGKFMYEAGQTVTSMSALTDSGDATTFTSAASLWSQYEGFEPVIRPNGVVSGCTIAPTTTNNQVSISAGEVNVNGTVVSVSADTLTLTRATTNGFKKCSIVVDNAGTISEVEGAEHTAHSDSRGANGGPPYITTTTVELGQVHFTAVAAAVVAASEIKTLLNVHREDANFPTYQEDEYNGDLVFSAALMLNHTSDVAKGVYASYAAPVFSEQVDVYDFTAVEEQHTVNSTPVYNGTKGAESSSLSQGGFSVFFRNGITDPLIPVKNKIVWVKFFPVRSRTEHILGLARLGVTRQWPAGDNIGATCTLTADTAFVEKNS